ncbi:unnamed protein product [Alternaria alternata]
MAKKTKRATKAASVRPPRPVTSPYTSPTVALHFGPTLQEYHLPDILLQQLENIPSRDPRTGKIHLADVDASIGHVLIHFLHTGVYQTLNNEAVGNIENTQQDIVLSEFQTALLTLEAAKKYGVPGLQNLAQIELERRGEDMCLLDAVRVIREDFLVGPSGEHAWLRDYVSMKVRLAFEHDPSAVLATDFFDSIESPTLTKLVAQITVGLLSEEIDKLRKEKTATGLISAPGHDELQGPCSPDIADLPSKRASEGPNAWPTSVQKFGAFDDSSAAWSPHDLGQNRSTSPEAGKPTVFTSIIEEDHATKSEDTESWKLDEDMIETQHLQAEEATIGQAQERDFAATNFPVTRDEVDDAEGQPLWDSWGGLAKKTKTSGVETSYSPSPLSPPDVKLEADPTLVIADVVTVDTMVSATREDLKTDEYSYAGLTNSRAKELRTKSDKEVKSKEDEDAKRQKEEEEATAAAAQAEKSRQDDIWGDWGPAPKASKKKKGKKGKQTEQIGLEEEKTNPKKTQSEEAAAGHTEAEMCQVKEDDLWNGWGFAKSMVQKKKESIHPEGLRRSEDEETERIRWEKENAAAAATTADLSVVGRTGTTFGDDDCRLRVEHLSQNYGWQNCKSCELYMRKIAMKLHSEGLPIQDGFNTIN